MARGKHKRRRQRRLELSAPRPERPADGEPQRLEEPAWEEPSLGGPIGGGVLTVLVVAASAVLTGLLLSGALVSGSDSAGSGARGAGASPPVEASPAADGAELFVASCGACHTLRAAGTTGSGGPDLDRLRPSEALVLRAIERGGKGTGAHAVRILAGEEARQVAAFVSRTAGR